MLDPLDDFIDLIDFLDRNLVGVQDRNVAVSSREIRRVSEQGVFGAREDSVRPVRNSVLNADFKAAGTHLGGALTKLTRTELDKLIDRLETLREEIYGHLGVEKTARARLTARAKALVTTNAQGVTPSQYRAVIPGYDEIVASAPAASLLSGGLEGIRSSLTQRSRAREALASIASVISAVRVPTQSGQARDDQVFGAFHPSDRETNLLRPVGGAGGHDSVNRRRATAGRDALRSVKMDKWEQVYKGIRVLVRTTSAATANSLVMSTDASNYPVRQGETQARRDRQSRDHEGLKRIARGRDRTRQPRSGITRSWRRRAISPERAMADFQRDLASYSAKNTRVKRKRQLEQTRSRRLRRRLMDREEQQRYVADEAQEAAGGEAEELLALL